MTTTKSPVPGKVPAWLAAHVGEVRAWPAVRGPHPLCRVTVCHREVHSLGLCRQHYNGIRARAKRLGQTTAEWVASNGADVPGFPAIAAPESPCWVTACGRSVLGLGLCAAHRQLARQRFRRSLGVAPASDSVPPTHTAKEANR